LRADEPTALRGWLALSRCHANSARETAPSQPNFKLCCWFSRTRCRPAALIFPSNMNRYCLVSMLVAVFVLSLYAQLVASRQYVTYTEWSAGCAASGLGNNFTSIELYPTGSCLNGIKYFCNATRVEISTCTADSLTSGTTLCRTATPGCFVRPRS
jgi:hypothetical protein